jgi:pimeloyl-ACP methyl ester carboxylesterase
VSEGRREPLLLLHGLGGSKEIWTPVLGLLEAERAPLALDLPGFGTEPPLAAQVEPSAANLAASSWVSSGPTSPATRSAAGSRWRWDGRAGPPR